MAGRLSLSSLRDPEGVRAAASRPLAVQDLRSADLCHGGDGVAPNPRFSSRLFLGRLSGRHPWAWAFRVGCLEEDLLKGNLPRGSCERVRVGVRGVSPRLTQVPAATEGRVSRSERPERRGERVDHGDRLAEPGSASSTSITGMSETIG
jgi:hypothetical protein